MKTVDLGSVATIERQGVDPSSVDPETLYLGLEHVERGGRILGHDTVGSAEVASTKFRFSREHVLFGKLRPNLGKISRPDFDGVCSTDILPVRPGKDLDRNYLAHYLTQPSMVDFAASRASGANLPRLSPAVLVTFPIPLPSLAEQRRIAAILDQADALRARRRQVVAHLDSLTQSILGEVLRGRFERVPFGELIGDGPKNGLYLSSSNYGSGAPIVRIDSFRFGSSTVATRSLKRLRASVGQVAEFGLKPGDLLVNRVNSREHVGKTALIVELAEPTVFESNLMRIRVDRGRLLPVFAAEFMQTRDARRQVAPLVKEAINQASINQGDVRSLLIPLPPLHLQQEFSRRVQRVNANRDTVQRALVSDDELFASLQYRAFRGEL